MNRPEIVCHMTMSLNKKTTGKFLEHPDAQKACEVYYRLHRRSDADGFICGKVTMDSSFTHDYEPDVSSYTETFPKEDYISDVKGSFYAIAFDTKGRLGWKDVCIHDEDPGYDGAVIIEILSHQVSDAYLCYLRKLGISYLFAGEDSIDPETALKKLYHYFGFKKLLLEGGGTLNGSFYRQNLIDEYSLVIAPVTELNQNEKNLLEGVEDPEGFKELAFEKEDEILIIHAKQ